MKRKLETTNNADLARVSRKIERFISGYLSKSSAKGLVIGLSGGLDSSVVLKLAVNALSPSRVLGIIMPSDATPKEDTNHASELAKSLGIKYNLIDINPIIEKYEALLPDDKKARGNLTARIRMNLLYYHAGVNGYLVVGTSDKSEVDLGYYTKFGDGAADIMPIASLYKTQVRSLAGFLNIPVVIIEKRSSPRLWDNHLAEEELGMDYETIDQILYLLNDRKEARSSIVAKKLGISTATVNKVKDMVEKGLHKRRLAPTPSA